MRADILVGSVVYRLPVTNGKQRYEPTVAYPFLFSWRAIRRSRSVTQAERLMPARRAAALNSSMCDSATRTRRCASLRTSSGFLRSIFSTSDMPLMYSKNSSGQVRFRLVNVVLMYYIRTHGSERRTSLSRRILTPSYDPRGAWATDRRVGRDPSTRCALCGAFAIGKDRRVVVCGRSGRRDLHLSRLRVAQGALQASRGGALLGRVGGHSERNS